MPAANRWTGMSGRVLADTNVIIALFAGDPAVVDRLQQQAAVFVCTPVLGELRYGVLASSRVEQNTARLDAFARAAVVLPCDSGTAAAYAEVKHQLRRKGRPIPENDVWIAALARQHALTLATRDAHFQAIDDLALELW